jgi:hypothetical protein
MTRYAVLMIPALLLASCGSGGDESAPPLQNDIMVRSDSQQRLFDLNDLDRAIALKRAISEQGLRCAQIVSTGYVTRFRDMDMWTATCSDKRQWALFVGGNDSVQVRLCADNEKIGLPACKVQPGTEGGTGLENVAAGNSAS